MRKIVMFNRISIDGFYAAADDNINWFIPDPEADAAIHQPNIVQPDTMLLGRITYQLFESVWPKVAADPNAPQEAHTTANEVNHMTKVVFSTTLQEVTWEKSILIHGNVTAAVRKFKQEDGADFIIFGSGTIIQQLADEGLIDEYLLLVTPVILGTGKLLFQDVKQSRLELLEARSFNSGNVLLRYKPHHQN
jgi:dihydrofolate reductase